MKCKSCKTINSSESKFCSECGEKLNQSVGTTYIGYLNSNGKLCENKNNIPLTGYRGYGVKKGFSAIQDSKVLFELVDSKIVNLRTLPCPKFKLGICKFDVKGGDCTAGEYVLSADGSCLVELGLSVSSENYKAGFMPLGGASVEVITEERAKEKLKSAVYGAVGALATLGVGLVVGVMHASKKFYLLEVRHENGSSIILECRPDAYQALLLAVKNTKVDVVEQMESYCLDGAKDSELLLPSSEVSFLDSKISPKNRTQLLNWGCIGLFVLVMVSCISKT